MASVTQLKGYKYVMVDGTALVTELIGNRCERHCIDLILQDMIEHEDMVAGLDIAWSESSMNLNRALLAICTWIGCILVWIEENQNRWSLEHFLDNKDITFFGVHMKEDVKRMRKRTSLGIRNIVDVSDLAADVLHKPRLRALGVRRLAFEVLRWPFKPRSFSMASFNCETSGLNIDQIECATINAYAAYKIGKRLLEI